ncbi:MAG: hypothetical protein ACL93V_11550 [Candidatus Electrothrix sp. YB6]
MKVSGIFCSFLTVFFFSTAALSAPPSKPEFEYLAYPDIMYTDNESSMSVCLVNYGGSGEVSHDGMFGDHTVISIPVGTGASSLLSAGGISSESRNPNWVVEVDEISVPGEIRLTFRPQGTYTVTEGEVLCLQVNEMPINPEMGLSFLNIDQQMQGAVQLPINTAMKVFKMTNSMAEAVELDPTVIESVKDGVSFSELTGVANNSQVPDNITINKASDADTVDGIHATELDESAEIDTDIALHSANPSSHHTKTTSFSELTDTASDDQIPDSITVNKAKDAETLSGVSADELEESADIENAIVEHASNPNAHHDSDGISSPLRSVYRFKHATGAQFYTISEDEKNRVFDRYPDDIWKYDGIPFCAYLSKKNGTVPVYRFWNNRNNAHFYTASEKEKNKLISDSDQFWNYERIEWHAFRFPESGTVPIYRLYSKTFERHFYTTSEGERDQLVAGGLWQYEGIGWYAFLCKQLLSSD